MDDTSLLVAKITFVVAEITFKVVSGHFFSDQDDFVVALSVALSIGCGHFCRGQDPFCGGLDTS